MSWTIVSKGWSKLSSEKARPHECQESGLVLKVILSDLTDFRGNECQITKNGDELVCPVKTNAVKKYSVKMKKLDKAQTWKHGLGKKECFDGLKTWKGCPCKS